MSIDQNPPSSDLLQLNPNRNLFNVSPSAPFVPPSSSTSADTFSSDEASDDQPSRRKVKLLCSFGGRILRRPSDGALRYAGGQTRIIAVRRSITLSELYRKMADAYGGPITIRYQLPDVDFDALVSVSSREDLDNMMDEYDKLAEASVDGSAKLRVFLFSQVEGMSVLADNISSVPTLIDPFDSGKKYIEAVNGDVRVKGRTASAASAQNSEASFDGSTNEGTSTVLSPSSGASTFPDPSKLAFVSTTTSGTLQETQGFPANSAVHSQTMVATHYLNSPQLAPCHSQAFVGSNHVHLVPPHSLNLATAPRIVNTAPIPQHTYPPPITMVPTSMPTQVESMKAVQGLVNPFSEDNQFGGAFVQPVSDPKNKVFQQPLSQIPPLQPSHLQPQNIEQYELHPVPPLPKGPLLRFEDCHMCQKSLPHVHSDMLINELGNVSGVSVPNARPVLYSHHSDDVARIQCQPMMVSVAMKESLMEPKVEHTVKPDQNGTSGVNKVPDFVLEREKFFMPSEKIDHSKLIQPMAAVGFSGDTQSSYGVLVSPPQSHLDGSFHQQQKFVHPMATFGLSSNVHSNGVYFKSQNHHDNYFQQLNVLPDICPDYNQALHPAGAMGLLNTGETSRGMPPRPPRPYHDDFLPAVTVPLLFPVNQDVSGTQCSIDSPVNNVNYNAMESLSPAQGNVRHADSIMEALDVNTFDILRSKDPLKPTVVPIADVSKDAKPESLFVAGDIHTFRPQNGGNALLSTNAFNSSAVGPEGISVKPINPAASNTGIEIQSASFSVVGDEGNTLNSYCGGSKLPSSNDFVSPGLLPKENPVSPLLSTAMDMHIFELANTSQVSTMTGSSVYIQNFERTAIPLPSNQLVSGIPYITDSAYSNTVTNGTRGVWTDEVCQVQLFINNASASQRTDFLNPSTLVGHSEQFQAIFSAGSPLCNENYQDTLESMYTYQPRPATVNSSEATVESREATVSGDMYNDNNIPKDKVSDIAVLLEEGALKPPIDWLLKDSHPDPVIATKDFIKQDLLGLANGESVLPSSMTPASVLSFSGSKELSPSYIEGADLHEDDSNSQCATVLGEQRIEDIKVKRSELHISSPTANVIGRLQIIKNCDLEELRELGSGTFGTVYHGKWRGSDVAIKRINDRCFAGKPSEQEKMRGDFWNEASKLADLHHPNVVAFYGVVLDGPGGSYATVTEYMVNGSLRNVLHKNDKTFDRWKRLLIAMDVAFGMEYLHGKNIVHFDLKSDNLLVNMRDSQRPICKVGDLGLSKVKCQTLISGGVRGTLPWMAPELLNGSSNLVSDKVDVFSFGIVMWELLTGEEPYSDLHYGTIIGGIVSNTLRPPVPENCDPEWRALMEQCWSAEPSERPSFTEIANTLRAMAGSLPHKGKAQR